MFKISKSNHNNDNVKIEGFSAMKNIVEHIQLKHRINCFDLCKAGLQMSISWLCLVDYYDY